MEEIPCTCGGENSRCFKCFGTGMHSKSNRALGDGRVFLSNLQSGNSKKRQKANSGSGKVIIKKVSNQTRTVKSNDIKLVRPVGFACSLCRIDAPTQLVLEAHQKAVHGSLGIKQRARNSERQEFQSGPGKIESRDALDTTRKWGGSFRDGSRFGSPVAHDAMDDESAP